MARLSILFGKIGINVSVLFKYESKVKIFEYRLYLVSVTIGQKLRVLTDTRCPLCTWLGIFNSHSFLEMIRHLFVMETKLWLIWINLIDSSTIECDWAIIGTKPSKNLSKSVSVLVLIGKINKIGIGISMLFHLH